MNTSIDSISKSLFYKRKRLKPNNQSPPRSILYSSLNKLLIILTSPSSKPYIDSLISNAIITLTAFLKKQSEQPNPQAGHTISIKITNSTCKQVNSVREVSLTITTLRVKILERPDSLDKLPNPLLTLGSMTFKNDTALKSLNINKTATNTTKTFIIEHKMFHSKEVLYLEAITFPKSRKKLQVNKTMLIELFILYIPEINKENGPDKNTTEMKVIL